MPIITHRTQQHATIRYNIFVGDINNSRPQSDVSPPFANTIICELGMIGVHMRCVNSPW
jgi:hypothetical protein